MSMKSAGNIIKQTLEINRVISKAFGICRGIYSGRSMMGLGKKVRGLVHHVPEFFIFLHTQLVGFYPSHANDRACSSLNSRWLTNVRLTGECLRGFCQALSRGNDFDQLILPRMDPLGLSFSGSPYLLAPWNFNCYSKGDQRTNGLSPSGVIHIAAGIPKIAQHHNAPLSRFADCRQVINGKSLVLFQDDAFMPACQSNSVELRPEHPAVVDQEHAAVFLTATDLAGDVGSAHGGWPFVINYCINNPAMLVTTDGGNTINRHLGASL